MSTIPPIPEKGDDDEDTTYAAVGYALSQWEFAELELCWLFAVLTGLAPGSREAVERYSGDTAAFARIEKLRAAAEACVAVSSDYQRTSDIGAIVRAAKEGCENRNKIAHGIVVVLRSRAPEVLTPLIHNTDVPEYCLVPAFYNKRQVDRRVLPTYLYVASDIRLMGAKFRDLYDAAYRFRADFAGPGPSWPRRPS